MLRKNASKRDKRATHLKYFLVCISGLWFKNRKWNFEQKTTTTILNLFRYDVHLLQLQAQTLSYPMGMSMEHSALLAVGVACSQ
jgi:hypothetical protein